MKINIKRIDKSLPLPMYETKGSVGFDILIREQVTIEPKSLSLLPGNVIVDTPKGYMLMIASRSSTPKKKGLLTPHGIGVLDQDYCGEEDELLIQVYNFTDNSVTIEKGEKIAQGVFVRVGIAEFNEVNKMSNKSRGGVGSTDVKKENN